MNVSDIAESIEAFVREQYDISPEDSGFGRNVDLFDEGYVDSIGLVELLECIRQTYGVEVGEEDLLSERFACIDGMSAVVAGLVRGSSTTPARDPAPEVSV